MIFLLLLVSSFTFAGAQVSDSYHVNQRAFADDLTASLYRNDNECTSALGISMAFSLVYPSMTGASMHQTQSIFGFPVDNSQLVWNDTETQLEGRYHGNFVDSDSAQGEPTVSISNSIWVDNQNNLNATYSDIVQEYLQLIDFSDASAADHVNTWVSNATRGLIDSIVESGPLSPAVLIAVNVIYFKAIWALPFDTYRTNQDAFYTSESRATTVSDNTLFMHQIASFPYSHEAMPGFQVLQLPFIDNSISIIIALPTSDDSGIISSSDLIGVAIPKLESTLIALALPRFKLESTYTDSLKSSLQALGITAPFSGGLCVFEGDCSAFIELIIQKTFISVDEVGVEAAAVTALVGRSIGSRYTEEPTLFLADHPFQFFIFEETTKLVLFEGRLGNPPPQNAASVELNARHNESDFWSSNFDVDPVVVQALPAVSTETPTSSSPRGGLLVSALVVCMALVLQL
jgi:serpin B